ncbi:MAG TPA: hypothetical protein VFJ90_03575, partial [Candidatus Didemnitutus sp.]|nr:hypothetical protein [Candidatus Didemnitutus sp.]
IANREELLRNYPRLGYDRATAAPVTDAGPRPNRKRPPRARSGLERKLQLLLRCDTQLPVAIVTGTGATENILERDDFYFVVEPVRFLPPGMTTPPKGSPFPAEAFAPSLFHVFINWTDVPLTAPLRAFAEARVLEEAPAHLWHRFIWLDPLGEAPGKPGRFRDLFRRWEYRRFPTLDQPARAADGSPALQPEDTAAHLLAWLLAAATPVDPNQAP